MTSARAAFCRATPLTAQETGLSKGRFTAEFPYPLAWIMDAGYWPEV